MNTIKKMVLTAGVIGACLMGGQVFAAGYGYGLGTGDCLSAFQNNIIDMQAARGKTDHGGYGPGDGTGNDGEGPHDGTGNGPGTGDCLGAIQLDIDHLQAARSGKGGNGSGRKGPGDGTGNGGNGPKDGSGNGNKTGDCPYAS